MARLAALVSQAFEFMKGEEGYDYWHDRYHGESRFKPIGNPLMAYVGKRMFPAAIEATGDQFLLLHGTMVMRQPAASCAIERFPSSVVGSLETWIPEAVKGYMPRLWC